MNLTPTMIGNGLVVLFVALTGLLKHFGDRKRDTQHGTDLDLRFAQLDLSLERRFNEVKSEVEKLSGIVIGVDGKNGIRSDVAEIKEWLDDLDERERERLNASSLHGAYDRRSS